MAFRDGSVMVTQSSAIGCSTNDDDDCDALDEASNCFLVRRQQAQSVVGA